MKSSSTRARRATLDDLDTLKKLWEALHLDGQELERRLTEFQVVAGPDGKVVGAVALQIAGRHGWIHSEVFADFSLSDQLRPALWERIQTLCMNHGIARLWTRENAPFWGRNGLQPASAEMLEKLPATWDKTASGWLTLQLKDEQAIASLDKEFALFVESERRNTAQALDQARTLKLVFTAIGLLLALILAGAAVYFMFTRKPPGSFGP